jgi:hypothetical protein
MWLSIFLGFIIILLFVIIGFLVKALQVQINKQKVYENWIIDAQNLVNKTYQTMRDIDNKGYFQSEDEVGLVFKELVEAIEYLNEVTKSE